MDREQLLEKRIAVIGGGWSDEREISLSSARECHRALLDAGFKTVDLLDLSARDLVGRLMGGGYDVAFVALHGRFGEDGSIQGLLDILHIPYTFSGVAASAAAAEKQIAKAVFKEAGIPVPDGVDLPAGVELSERGLDSLIEQLGLPLFVKPAANGSSFGPSAASWPRRFDSRGARAAACSLRAASRGSRSPCRCWATPTPTRCPWSRS